MAHQFMKRTPSLTKDRIQVLFWSIDRGKLSLSGSGSPRIGNTTHLGAKKEYTGSMYRYPHSRRSCLKGQRQPYETAGLRDVGYKKQALSHSDKENTSERRRTINRRIIRVLLSPNGGRSPHGYPPKPEIPRNLEATRDIPLGKPDTHTTELLS